MSTEKKDVQKLRLYEYECNGKKGHISGYSSINAKVRVARRGIASLPLEVTVREIEEDKKQ